MFDLAAICSKIDWLSLSMVVAAGDIGVHWVCIGAVLLVTV